MSETNHIEYKRELISELYIKEKFLNYKEGDILA